MVSLPIEIINIILCDNKYHTLICRKLSLMSGKYVEVDNKLLADGIWKCYNKTVIFDKGIIISVKYCDEESFIRARTIYYKYEYKKSVNLFGKEKSFDVCLARTSVSYVTNVYDYDIIFGRYGCDGRMLVRKWKLISDYYNHIDLDLFQCENDSKLYLLELILNTLFRYLGKIIRLHGVNIMRYLNCTKYSYHHHENYTEKIVLGLISSYVDNGGLFKRKETYSLVPF